MQKIMICLAKPNTSDASAWNDSITKLLEENLELFFGCSYSIVDGYVLPAKSLEIINTTHPKDAVLSIWADSAHELGDFFTAVARVGQYQAYGVMESTAISHQQQPGKVAGMCQIALLKKPKSQPRTEWLEAWLGRHTQIAIDTQASFAYRQNVVAVPILSHQEEPSWPFMDAIVEESFPAKAMTSQAAFFAAEGDPGKLAQHQRAMLNSCMKFIDFECFDCVPMSQYIVKMTPQDNALPI